MKLTNKIHLLQIDFEITLSPEKKVKRFVNVILIMGDKITLIDSGVKGSKDKIFDYIRQNGRKFSEIDTIILSHSHPDHIGGAAEIKKMTGCKILAHKLETEWIENIELQNKQRPVPGFFNLVDESVKVDGYLSNGQELRGEDGVTLQFIHSPGHSKGLVNVYFKEDKILFTADAIPLKNDIPNYDNYLDLMKSLAVIKKNIDYKILLTSWTPPLIDKTEIGKLFIEGEEYMRRIDLAVKRNYNNRNIKSLAACKATVEDLKLPAFLVNPIVDMAFRSHIN